MEEFWKRREELLKRKDIPEEKREKIREVFAKVEGVIACRGNPREVDYQEALKAIEQILARERLLFSNDNDKLTFHRTNLYFFYHFLYLSPINCLKFLC